MARHKSQVQNKRIYIDLHGPRSQLRELTLAVKWMEGFTSKTAKGFIK